MEDALLAQLQNTSLEEHDDKDRIEAETDSEVEDEKEHGVEQSVSFIVFPCSPKTNFLVDFTFIEIIFTARRRGKSKGTSNRSQRGKGRSNLSATK